MTPAPRSQAGGLLLAAAIVLVVTVIVAALSTACTGLWAKQEFWIWTATMGLAGLAIGAAGLHGGSTARLLAAAPAGLVAAVQFGPSLGGVVALLVTALTLRSAPRDRLAATVGLFVVAAVAGIALVTALSSSTSC